MPLPDRLVLELTRLRTGNDPDAAAQVRMLNYQYGLHTQRARTCLTHGLVRAKRIQDDGGKATLLAADTVRNLWKQAAWEVEERKLIVRDMRRLVLSKSRTLLLV